MPVCQPHNLRARDSGQPRPYGVRVSLRASDPFIKLLGPNWNRTHWYEAPEQRDNALHEMSRKHEYSRPGDRPALVYEKVEKLAESLSL